MLFSAGCNFTCPFCHNPDLVINGCKNLMAIEEKAVLKFLDQRQSFLDGIVISGGEPTIQKDLISFCRKIKQYGYQLKLDTNGSHPQVIEQLIDSDLVNYIAMDIKTDPLLYSPILCKSINPNLISKSIRIIMNSSLPYEFRTTCVKPFVDIYIVETIVRLIEGAAKFVLQQFQNANVLMPEFFYTDNAGYGEIELLHFRSIAKPWVKKCTIRQHIATSDTDMQKPDRNRAGFNA